MQTPDRTRLSAAREALAAAEQAAGASGPVPGDGPSDAEAYRAARQVVLRQLAVGPRTRQQLADKLRDRGCADHVATQVLDRMTEVGLIDDQSYAEMLVRTRQDSKGLAVPALRHELRRKGVPEELVERALDEVDPQRERAQAEDLVATRLRTMHGLDRVVQTRRLAGFLARKGYSAGVSYAVIRDALEREPQHRRD